MTDESKSAPTLERCRDAMRSELAQYSIDSEGYPYFVRSILTGSEMYRGEYSACLTWIDEQAARACIGAQWQPIETAPKDGTIILLYHPTRGRVFENVERGFFDEGQWMARGGIGLNRPTHWMPLPGPPTAVLREEA